MFRGSSFHTIDPKGRITVPARFREFIKATGSNGVMVSRMDNCLPVYTLEEWYKIESRILALAETSEHIRRFRRLFVGGAFECHFDKQERILIPQSLRIYGDLKKEIVMVGVLDHFEIWSRQTWDQEHFSMEEDLKTEEVRNEIARLGL